MDLFTVFLCHVRDEVETGGASVWEFPINVLDFTGGEKKINFW